MPLVSIRPFIDLPRVDAMGPAALNSLNFQLALVQLCHVLGKDTFKELYQEIQVREVPGGAGGTLNAPQESPALSVEE